MPLEVAARITGLSPTTLRELGKPGKDTSDRTLSKLTELGLSPDELHRARAEDRGRPASDWSVSVTRLAMTATRLSRDDQALLLSLADAIVSFRSARRGRQSY